MEPNDPGDLLKKWLGANNEPWTPLHPVDSHLQPHSYRPSSTFLGYRETSGYRESGDVLHPDKAGSNMGEDSGYGSVKQHSDSVQGDSIGDRSRMSDIESMLGRSYIEQAGPSNPLASTMPKVSSDSGHTIPGPSRPSFICPECNMMFRRPSELKKHLKRHEKPYRCEYMNCSRGTNGFSTKNDLIRHQRTVHGERPHGDTFVCHHEPCSSKEVPKYWPRADNFRHHLMRVHKISLSHADDLTDYVYTPVKTSEPEADPVDMQGPESKKAFLVSASVESNKALPVINEPDGLQAPRKSLMEPPKRIKEEPHEEGSGKMGGGHSIDYERCIMDFEYQLFEWLLERLRTKSSESVGQTAMRIVGRLPDLLEHCAHMADKASLEQYQRDFIIHVHACRNYIARKFEDIIQRSLSGPSPMTRNDSLFANLAKQESKDLILKFFKDDVSQVHDEPTKEDPKAVAWASSKADGSNISDRSFAFTNPLLNSEALKWLLSRLEMEIQLNREIIAQIGHAVESQLKSPAFAGNATHRVTFNVNCDLEEFWRSQIIDDPGTKKILSKRITITGSSQNAQALTCGQYLTQTWPVTGPQMCQHLDTVFMGDNGVKYSDDLIDGTRVTTYFDAEGLVTKVSGTSASILDIGELLAWLGGTLQISPDPSRLAYVYPYMITHTEMSDSSGSPTISHHFSFKTGNIDDPTTTHETNGRCWHHLFKNPVIVKGYPVTSKARTDSGIEIPLNIMAAMIGSEKIDEYDGKCFIKGFSKMLVPVEKDNDSIYWHLYRTESYKRIPYWHPTTSHAAYIDNAQMERCGHILGWTLQAEFLAGSSQANYDIPNLYLEGPGSQSPFSGISVTPGSFIRGGPAFAISRNDVDVLLIGRVGRLKQLKWMAKQKLLLWDEPEKRGWLVNGLTALLHLVRAFLHNDGDGIPGSRFLFRPELLQEPQQNTRLPNTAAHVLFRDENLALKVYDDEDYGTFRDTVDVFYNILEKLIDYQKRICGDNGANMVNQPRQILEGWDFNDLIMNHDDRIFPRIVTLETAGLCWVDFIRSLSIVTLFGRGFGDLIRPTRDQCSKWESLPPEKSYIAAPLSDIKDLINVQHHNQTHHTRLGRMIWHTETELFDKCSCDDDRVQNYTHEPVQSLIPSFMSRDLPGRTSNIPMPDSGAVILGSHSQSSLVWTDFGPPSAGTMNPVFMKAGPVVNDSGYGTSVSSLSTSQRTHSASPVLGAHTRQSENTVGSQRSPPKPIDDPKSYSVGIICALAKEFVVVRALLDQTFSPAETPEYPEEDRNIYVFGQMGQHMVVCTTLPYYGNNPAAICAENLRRSFRNILFCFLVGIGGGIPSALADVRLGDVVVSVGVGELSAVIQYDLGKRKDNGDFTRTGCLPNPPAQLLGAIAHIRSDPLLIYQKRPLEVYLEQIRARIFEVDDAVYQYPGSHLDVLMESVDQSSSSRPKQRDPRAHDGPVIHYGPIASGNSVIKSAKFRDMLALKDGVLCCDMEAAGVAEAFPSQLLVVRGICDYSDAQKNKEWQDYAAATAAAYVKLLLRVVPANTRRPAQDWEEHTRKRTRMEA